MEKKKEKETTRSTQYEKHRQNSCTSKDLNQRRNILYDLQQPSPIHLMSTETSLDSVEVV